jgi:uncharacterized membrane protein YjjP (DUF1212 family)
MESVERALDVAIIVLKNGGSTGMADLAFRNVLAAFGHQGVVGIWRQDMVGACGDVDGRAFSLLRPVGGQAVNLHRVSEALTLSVRAASGEVRPEALGDEVERINQLPPPHGRWVTVGAAAVASAAFARLSGGDWGSCATVLAAAASGQVLRTALQSRRFRSAAATLFSGMLSACVAAAGLRIGLSHTQPATLIASVIYMVPGLPLINGFLDIVSQQHLLAGWERLLQAGFIFLVLTIAVVFAYAVIL